MTDIEILRDIMRDIFDDDNLVITPNTSADDIEDWDSLALINIIVASENAFGIKFDIKEVTAIQTVGHILSLIESKKS